MSHCTPPRRARARTLALTLLVAAARPGSAAGQTAPDAAPATPAQPVPAPDGSAAAELAPAAELTPAADAPLTDDADYGATAEVEAPRDAPTERVITPERVRTTAGAQGDPLRAVDTQPGVARSPAGFGMVLVRGSGGDDSMVAVEGARIPVLFHFGSLRGVVAAGLVDSVVFQPGNLAPRYGRVMGGVVDLRLRDPRTDGVHGALELGLLDASALVEAPWGSGGTAVAARRSHFDALYPAFAPDTVSQVVAAPVYWDYQSVTTQRLGDQRLRLLAFGASDHLELVLAGAAAEDPALRGRVGGALAFHRAGLQLDGPVGDRVSHRSSIIAGTLDLEQRLGTELEQIIAGHELSARSEWTLALAPELSTTAGVDVQGFAYRGTYRGPVVAGTEGDPAISGPAGLAQSLTFAADEALLYPAVYLGASWRGPAGLELLPSVRLDGASTDRSVTVDPRLAARWAVSPTTTLKGGYGRHGQPPLFWQTLPGIGNPALRPSAAWHASLGVEQALGERVEVSVEAFHKRLVDRVVGTEGAAPPRFVNDGTGTIVGADLSVEARPVDAVSLGLAYTLSRSERRDRGGPSRLFDQDQPHVLAVLGSAELGAGWTASATFRATSGTPTTPITGAVFDARSGLYQPVYGRLNSERTPAWHRLDLRLEKSWRLGPPGPEGAPSGEVAAFLEVINATAAENREGTRWSYDYRRSEPVRGLPLFPNLGLRGAL